MLTIFSTPKPFRGNIAIIQTNAIRSWLSLRPACEIILFGNDEGTAEISSGLGIKHIPDVARNEYGTPLVSSMFSIAQDVASHDLMSYINADIILMSDFLPAIRQVRKQLFLLVGRRWDINLNDTVDFNNAAWEEHLRARLGETGILHGKSGIDYFVFPAGCTTIFPPLPSGAPAGTTG